MSRDELVDQLIAERYAKPTWWKTPERGHARPPVVAPEFDNSEVAQAKRRRDMAADFDQLNKGRESA